MENKISGNRIIIIGSSGSGKSTLARQLQQITGLPLFSLDNIWWNRDRTHISREEFDRRLRDILHGDAWIIDGDYSRTYEPRIRACDTVLFLDYDEACCMDGVRQRLGRQRSDLPWTEPPEPDPELTEMICRYRQKNRPRLMELFAQYPDKRLCIFSTREEADEWLQSL